MSPDRDEKTFQDGSSVRFPGRLIATDRPSVRRLARSPALQPARPPTRPLARSPARPPSRPSLPIFLAADIDVRCISHCVRLPPSVCSSVRSCLSAYTSITAPVCLLPPFVRPSVCTTVCVASTGIHVRPCDCVYVRCVYVRLCIQMFVLGARVLS